MATIMMTTWVDSRCRTCRQRGTRIHFPSRRTGIVSFRSVTTAQWRWKPRSDEQNAQNRQNELAG
jgi:hypothetical protein